MSLRISFAIASLMIITASTSFAQGPRLFSPDADGPVLFGPEAGFESGPEVSVTQIPVPRRPGVRIAPVPESNFPIQGELPPGYATPGYVNPEAVDPNAPGIIIPQVDAAPMLVEDCDCHFYSRVRYKNKGKISPCAETMVVSVIDPCSRKYDCEIKCVQVKICAPTCGCPKVKVSRSGRHTRYDFGKYAIDIYSNRNGTILVDYDA